MSREKPPALVSVPITLALYALAAAGAVALGISTTTLLIIAGVFVVIFLIALFAYVLGRRGY